MAFVGSLSIGLIVVSGVTYSIGALLLDLQDPRRVLARLPQPLLAPDASEREGYVPNVTYSCGALAHGRRLIVPYGCADTSIGIAVIDLPQLLDQIGGQVNIAGAIL